MEREIKSIPSDAEEVLSDGNGLGQTYSQEEKEFAKQNHLSKSFARKILAGELTLDQVRERIRLQNQPLKNKGLTYLLKHLKSETPFIFACHYGDVPATVKKIRKFDLHVLELKAGAVRRIKKLDIKYFYKAAFAEDILDLMKLKPALQKEELPPVLEPGKRFRLDRQQLEGCRAGKKPVKVTLRGGEIFQGTLRWVSDYESKLQLDDKVAVVFFHHALYDFSVVAAK